MAKCLWTTLKNNENDGKYRCAGRIQAQGTREFIDNLHTILQIHTSKINVLCSSLNSEEMLQNFLYLYKKKTQVVFFVFHFEQLSFFPYECPGLCRHRPGHS